MVHLPIKIIISLENLSSNIGMISGISTWLKSSGRIRRSQKIGKKMAHESRFATGFEIWLSYTHPMGFFTQRSWKLPWVFYFTRVVSAGFPKLLCGLRAHRSLGGWWPIFPQFSSGGIPDFLTTPITGSKIELLGVFPYI